MSLTAALKVTVIMKGKCIVITYISVMTLSLLKFSTANNSDSSE